MILGGTNKIDLTTRSKSDTCWTKFIMALFKEYFYLSYYRLLRCHFSVVLVASVLSLQIAKVEKLKPLEVELRRLEDLSESIVNDFAYMKKREEEMRDTNGKKTMQLVRQLDHT